MKLGLMILFSLQLTLIRERGRKFSSMWDSKKAKSYKVHVPWPGAKKHPHMTNFIKLKKISRQKAEN